MNTDTYKKMAGTAAVFLSTRYQGASPVERDGLIWTRAELHLDDAPQQHRSLPAMPNTLALEGLEDYDPAQDGDCRRVDSVGVEFIYSKRIRGWVQIEAD